MTISVRLNEEDTALFKSYAALNNITLSELVRNAVMEKIEEEFDLQVDDEAAEDATVDYDGELTASLKKGILTIKGNLKAD